ncbi:hypothetical protein DFR44_10320 [Hydromonas duriensis]|uniref:Uncharacterized protein n=1 Tax=Hydromonas duriensis TaxID=1527608 RepID=A0A4R6YAC3_9BURK|nr:hypothetical protein DFR44_10320 [Hydromonas duriensis]
MLLLDDVHTPDDFKVQLWRTRTIMHASQDFYYEYHLMQRWLHQSKMSHYTVELLITRVSQRLCGSLSKHWDIRSIPITVCPAD